MAEENISYKEAVNKFGSSYAQTLSQGSPNAKFPQLSQSETVNNKFSANERLNKKRKLLTSSTKDIELNRKHQEILSSPKSLLENGSCLGNMTSTFWGEKPSDSSKTNDLLELIVKTIIQVISDLRGSQISEENLSLRESILERVKINIKNNDQLPNLTMEC